MYWCALIRIRFAQINQTFHSTILVFIIVVSLHSDAYLRSLTLSHKIGGRTKCAGSVQFGEKCAGSVFFSKIYKP